MKDVYIFTSMTEESNGRQRTSEYRYYGIVDNEGDFKLKGCLGRIYPAKVIEANPTKHNEAPSFKNTYGG